MYWPAVGHVWKCYDMIMTALFSNKEILEKCGLTVVTQWAIHPLFSAANFTGKVCVVVVLAVLVAAERAKCVQHRSYLIFRLVM